MTVTEAHISGYSEGERAGMDVFKKPQAGSWTAAFGLDTGPVSYKDSYDPEFYELEKEAVFRRSWLNVGRVEDLPRRGSYFTKEFDFLNASVVVIRGMDNEIRAFHNVCSHRGNKLLWDDYPSQETRGTCRSIACKYHGWRYALDGEIEYVHNAPEFFDLKAEDLALPRVHVDEWAGFIFVNLDKQPQQSLREFLTPTVEKLETYPFDKLKRMWTFGGIVKSNWKLFMDAFAEIYHVPYVHSRQNSPGVPPTGTDKIPMMMASFSHYGKHGLFSSGGINANKEVRGPRPLDDLFGSSLFGSMEPPDIGPLGDGINPERIENWGLDSWQLYPNFVVLFWNKNWVGTYHYWPKGPNSHEFIYNIYTVPPKNAAERLAQEHMMLTVREFGFEDANTLEATQRSVESGARDHFYVSDQEVLVRFLHTLVQQDVAAYQEELEGSKGTRGVR